MHELDPNICLASLEISLNNYTNSQAHSNYNMLILVSSHHQNQNLNLSLLSNLINSIEDLANTNLLI